VPEEEIRRAIKQARALFAYQSENITGQAAWLGHAEMFANYEWFLTYLDRLSKVTPSDIQTAAQKYLRRKTAWLEPIFQAVRRCRHEQP